MSDKPKPPDLDQVDELGDYWREDTTITVNRYTKTRLDEIRDDRPWDVFLEKLRREHSDPLTMNDGEQIVEYLETQLETIATDVDESEIARMVVADLKAELPEAIAQELQK